LNSSLDLANQVWSDGYIENFKIAGGDSQKSLFFSNLGDKFYDATDNLYFQKKIN
jgi:hypothetical protein